jgi:adenylyltransferase/sulfurtransferase
MIDEISVKELKKMIENGEEFQLLDVREADEYAFANLGGELMPMNSVPDRIDEIDRDKKVVVMCRSGKRSAHIVAYLKKMHNFGDVYNLKGGILAYSDEIDPSIPKY